jgi:hypothetical protein
MIENAIGEINQLRGELVSFTERFLNCLLADPSFVLDARRVSAACQHQFPLIPLLKPPVFA